MPNWVHNALHCHGSESDLDSLAEFFAMDVEVHSWNPEMGTYDLVTQTVPFTYMAMRNPFLPPYNVSREEYHSVSVAPRSLFIGTNKSSGNWYNWNNYNWGVKWDASVQGVERENELLSYHFESPWGPPGDLMLLEMSQKFPSIAFTHHYEEEQGWGREYEFQNGEISESDEWDIPTSHADYVDRDRTCICEYEDDPEYMYPDCPKNVAEGIDSTLALV